MTQNLATVEKLHTDEEYLEFERAAADRHELIDGEIVAMEGLFAFRRRDLRSNFV